MAATPDEEQFYRENEANLARRFAGKIVVIRGRKVVAVYESRSVAEREAQREFGTERYVVKAIARPPRTSGPFRSERS